MLQDLLSGTRISFPLVGPFNTNDRKTCLMCPNVLMFPPLGLFGIRQCERMKQSKTKRQQCVFFFFFYGPTEHNSKSTFCYICLKKKSFKWHWKYLKLLRETLHVVLVELHDVFNEVLNWDGLHVVCRRKHRTQKPMSFGGFLCRKRNAQFSHIKSVTNSRFLKINKGKRTD